MQTAKVGLFGECRVLAMDLPLKPPRGNGG
jgi:hypothetical protein